ncbi:hypothetical protein CEUSTIGMA_g7144.t1 [Chlamydomonas eustigma]|uniref:Uncharacterized protein n=1 Tax=Chlamydomonas eustigma TaxID=1157962 RepID=A0A250X9D8_9CHLO|nr:hypothetical protein CEUSTIGMA_g7144.t1 [Chlamydomonas eustigma]|eukprot:GAX79703.1 hypothetical protein CEUSTIGMA_g7144.t1 [Chlamydomonas eustigma]
MGKNNKKKLKSDDEFFELLTSSNAAGGWQTGPASAMDLDGKETAVLDLEDAQKHPEADGTASASSDMHIDRKMSKKLAVAKTSMKRGQRTKAQRLRKASKLEKAMGRAEKIGVRVDGTKARRLSKLSLKHMY